MQKLLALLCMLFVVIAGHAQLSPQEITITNYINAHINGAIKLLQQSVNINSGTLNIAGVKAVGELYATELKTLGFPFFAECPSLSLVR